MLASINDNIYNVELDSHADTTCCGRGFELLGEPLKICSVEPFLSSYEPKMTSLLGHA